MIWLLVHSLQSCMNDRVNKQVFSHITSIYFYILHFMLIPSFLYGLIFLFMHSGQCHLPLMEIVISPKAPQTKHFMVVFDDRVFRAFETSLGTPGASAFTTEKIGFAESNFSIFFFSLFCKVTCIINCIHLSNYQVIPYVTHGPNFNVYLPKLHHTLMLLL